ncbi:phosphatases II, partial [Fistulina hepatica ATCC 64428]
SPPLPADSFVLGNLFLSSCPGKKVRLSGPVRGRNGVCRELAVDLRRMKNLGVECVVCCLDDEELSFLGSPWTEYEKVAREIGLDVLRIPMPEGLAPMSLTLANEYVTRLIYTYTLRGMSVLVHCRGGVGRAGVIACCWLLKLGLCGSLPDSGGDAPDWDLGSADNAMLVLTRPLRSVVDMVSRVIALVRRRRSIKAIETFEQVLFLVEYVEYLN